MIFEHEIPVGSKLYFGESAKLKRQIENTASEILYENGFDEIVTPSFSYHQHLSIADERELVRVNDEKNHYMSMRADSTIDVVRVVEKRLGQSTKQNKWFYIQPVFRYPSIETNQVGAEIIGEDNVSKLLAISAAIFNKLEIKPLLQLSNIKIPKLIAQELGLDIDVFKHIQIDKLLALELEWLTKLVYLSEAKELDALIKIAPAFLKDELRKLQLLCEDIVYDNVIIAPLYYAKIRYYDDLFFRYIEDNKIYAKGGRYEDANRTSVGFALYSDDIIEKLNKGNK